MSVTLGDMIYWIRGKADKLPEDLDKSSEQVKKFGKKVSETLKEQMNMAVGMFMSQGMMQLSGALKNFTADLVNSTVEYSNQMQDLAMITGMTLEDSSRLYNVADDLRIGYSDLSSAMRLYANYLQQAGTGEQASIESLAALSEEYLKLAPGVERTAWLQDRFGRGGAEMGKLLQVGSQGIKDMSSAVNENLIVTEESVKKTEAYRLALDDMEDSIFGLKIALGEQLLPYLTDFTNWATTNGVPALQGLVDGFTNLPEPIQKIVIGLVGILTFLTAFAPSILAIKNLAWPLLVATPGLLTNTLFPAMAKLGAFITSFISAPIAGLIGAIVLLIAVIGTMGRKAWTAFTQLYDIMMTLLTRVAKNLGLKSVEAGLNIAYGIGKGLMQGATWLVNIVIKFSEAIVNAIKKALKINSPSEVFAVEVGVPSAKGIGKGFRDGLQGVITTMQSGVQMLPAGALAGGGMGGSINVGHVEYHGSFSDEEREGFNKSAEMITGKVLRKALRR